MYEVTTTVVADSFVSLKVDLPIEAFDVLKDFLRMGVIGMVFRTDSSQENFRTLTFMESMGFVKMTEIDGGDELVEDGADEPPTQYEYEVTRGGLWMMQQVRNHLRLNPE